MKKILFIVIVLLVFASPAAAVTRYIDISLGANCTTGNYSIANRNCTGSDGNAYRGTYADAKIPIEAMAPGDTTYLRAGTYDLRIGSGLGGISTFPRMNIPSGTSGSRITIAGYPGETVWLIPTAVTAISVYGGNASTDASNYVTFDNLKADATNVSDGESATSTGNISTNMSFTNCEIKNASSWNGSPGSAASGMLVGSPFTLVRNCHIHHNGIKADADAGGGGGYAIYLPSNDATIENNELHDNFGYGVHQYKSGSSAGSNNVIRFNRVYNNALQSGVNSSGIIMSSGTNNQAYGNVVYDTNGHGIEMSDGGTCTKCLVYNNTIVNSRFAGIKMTGSGAVVRNNIIVNSNSGGVGSGSLENNGTGASFSNNLCFGTGGTTNCNITTDPLFVNMGAKDFRLQAGSPAINAGVNLGSSYSPDMASVARPASGPWEIGAYEYGIPVVATNQLVVALPLEETGSIAVDVSGQKNNATLVGGATWDNAGKYGKAVALDGTGYLNIPASPSLALSPAMTLESWVYPTTVSSTFSAVIVQDRYYLYAGSDVGYCASPALAPLGGYSTTTVQHYLCATSIPPINQWSHLAVTHDGVTTIFYLNGNIIASQTSTDPMVPTAQNMTIGASSFGENFVGKIDQPMVYNYPRTQAQIQSDMNTSLITPPGKYVEIAAPASIEISSASSIEIGAD